ncbi:T9SS type A sorting domain-containing protein [Flavobacterium dankookense]|uniref:Putative secreted protein (Por secretion system target) n=1 Tax=Flavobacterium dankookense TaxID=706186 RepID=A0A4V3CSR0_9FLAO|nr:T9SS type A sorting domain-containing protein [Flavobacterium dankookense]TDP61577.1 putative secreted protein (Por secretion system target) [Flavobacterium dankookense]
MKKYIYSLLAVMTMSLSSAQLSSLSQAEYFWDADPGEGNGTAITAVDGSFNSVFEKIAVSGLNAPSIGLHKFSVRIKDNSGVWGPVFTNVIIVESTTTPNPITLTQAEYFWDADPGEGSATPLLAVDGDFNSAFEKVAVAGLGAPSVGLHTFSIRVKDNQGVWGPTFTNSITVESTTTPLPVSLTQAEYFWDVDPGEGSATPLLAFDGNFNTAFEKFLGNAVPIVNPVGLHKFCVRVKDNQGTWGPIFTNVIYIESVLGVNPHDMADNYYFIPNPATSVIRFNKDIKNITIVDMNGRQIAASISNNEVNIEGLAKGTYILKVTTPEGKTFNKKMIKR